jgi:hypothetical protein
MGSCTNVHAQSGPPFFQRRLETCFRPFLAAPPWRDFCILFGQGGGGRERALNKGWRQAHDEQWYCERSGSDRGGRTDGESDGARPRQNGQGADDGRARYFSARERARTTTTRAGVQQPRGSCPQPLLASGGPYSVRFGSALAVMCTSDGHRAIAGVIDNPPKIFYL